MRILKSNKKLPVLLVDSHERHPWAFDSDPDFEEVKRCPLEIGDYSLKGYENIICIERKADANELFTNFGKNDKERTEAAMTRLSECEHKFIVIEQSLEDVLDQNSYYINIRKINRGSPKMPAIVVIQGIIDFMLDKQINVIFAGNKGKEIAKGILLQFYAKYR